MGDPSPRYARRAEPQHTSAARVPLTPLCLPSHAAAAAFRCPTVAASPVSARRDCQRRGWSARPRGGSASPASLATPRATARRLHEYRGGPVAAWPQESARQPPRRSTETPSDSMWPNVLSAGRLPARHRDYGGSGTGLRLSAPTSASADNAACGSPVDGGTLPRRHESRICCRIRLVAKPKPEPDHARSHNKDCIR